MNLQEEAKRYSQDIVAWRRDFHQHPEVGFALPRTSGIVADLLAQFGLEVHTGFAPCAVLGILDTGRPGKTVAIRADMDALRVQEQTGAPYASQTPGVCHACGHDAHTALVLGLAQYLSEHRETLNGTIKFIFQPAEEGPAPGGAKTIVDSGALGEVDVLIGSHAQPLYRAGQIGVKYGEAFASGDFFEVKLTGEGCHAASPHRGKDLLATAAEIISAFQVMRAREVPPLKSAVVSVCYIQGGSAQSKNVLPAEVVFGGTFRAHDESVRALMARRLKEISCGIAALHGCRCEFTDEFMFPPFSNDYDVIDTIYRSAVEVLGKENVIQKPDPEMGSEDFAYYTQKYKAAFFFFGVRNEEKGCINSLHHPAFDLDEDTFAPTLAVYINTVYNLLGSAVV